MSPSMEYWIAYPSKFQIFVFYSECGQVSAGAQPRTRGAFQRSKDKLHSFNCDIYTADVISLFDQFVNFTV